MLRSFDLYSYVNNDIELQLDKYLAQIDRPTRQSPTKVF